MPIYCDASSGLVVNEFDNTCSSFCGDGMRIAMILTKPHLMDIFSVNFNAVSCAQLAKRALAKIVMKDFTPMDLTVTHSAGMESKQKTRIMMTAMIYLGMDVQHVVSIQTGNVNL